jgi:hypothetical protein
MRGKRRGGQVSYAELGGDVIEDLEDQAAWSNYTQHIPRPGDPRRDRI